MRREYDDDLAVKFFIIIILLVLAVSYFVIAYTEPISCECQIGNTIELHIEEGVGHVP